MEIAATDFYAAKISSWSKVSSLSWILTGISLTSFKGHAAYIGTNVFKTNLQSLSLSHFSGSLWLSIFHTHQTYPCWRGCCLSTIIRTSYWYITTYGSGPCLPFVCTFIPNMHLTMNPVPWISRTSGREAIHTCLRFSLRQVWIQCVKHVNSFKCRSPHWCCIKIPP